MGSGQRTWKYPLEPCRKAVVPNRRARVRTTQGPPQSLVVERLCGDLRLCVAFWDREPSMLLKIWPYLYIWTSEGCGHLQLQKDSHRPDLSINLSFTSFSLKSLSVVNRNRVASLQPSTSSSQPCDLSYSVTL